MWEYGMRIQVIQSWFFLRGQYRNVGLSEARESCCDTCRYARPTRSDVHVAARPSAPTRTHVNVKKVRTYCFVSEHAQYESRLTGQLSNSMDLRPSW
jgi:hypothetical protein